MNREVWHTLFPYLFPRVMPTACGGHCCRGRCHRRLAGPTMPSKPRCVRFAVIVSPKPRQPLTYADLSPTHWRIITRNQFSFHPDTPEGSFTLTLITPQYFLLAVSGFNIFFSVIYITIFFLSLSPLRGYSVLLVNIQVPQGVLSSNIVYFLLPLMLSFQQWIILLIFFHLFLPATNSLEEE